MSTIAAAPQKKGNSKQGASKRDVGAYHASLAMGFSNAEDETMYYRDAAHILFHYYNIMEKGDAAEPYGPGTAAAVSGAPPSAPAAAAAAARARGSRKQCSILEFIDVPSAKDAPPGDAEERDDVAQNKYGQMSRCDLLESYMRLLNGRLPADAPRPVSDRNHSGPTNLGMTGCRHCGTAFRSLVASEGYLVCDKCDTVEYVNIDNDKPSYGDPPREISYFCYKRQNHFQEWISQTQGREYTNIPQSVYDAIFEELARQKIVDVSTLSQARVKSVMKKLSLNKYYEHIPHILNHMSGTPLARIPPELEAQLRRMFQQIQVPFMRHSPPNRRNFLSYSFVLHKFIQLLGHDELLVNFPLLKSREKLHLQDITWKRICSDLQWEFIRSV